MIEKIDYLPTERVPENPKSKKVIPDVSCMDERGNRFIVEMQVNWAKNFYQRLLFGIARAYGHKLSIGENYKDLKKVIGIGLVDSIFEKEMSQWYHHYQLRHTEKPDKLLEDLQLLLIELPKYRAKPMADKSLIKLLDLWLQFLSLGENTREVPRALLAVPEIEEAVHLAEVAAYSEAELHSYERNLDAIRTESTLIRDHREEGIAEGRKKEKVGIAKSLLSQGLDVNMIASVTGLSVADIQKLVKG